MLKPDRQQRGTVLIVSLVLLTIITILAISGMSTATSELALARNKQFYEDAFQAAETGLEESLAAAAFSTSGVDTFIKQINAHDSVAVQVQFAGQSIVPDKAFSLGSGSGVSAYHFVSMATASSRREQSGRSDRDVDAVHRQAFYVLGPESSAPIRMQIAGRSQNIDQTVIVTGAEDERDAGIRILDFATGERLWHTDMEHAIAGQVRVIDLNGDGLADRMYATDLGNQVWRFDIRNGEVSDPQITGGIIAQLGSRDAQHPYNAPDVSLITDAHQQRRYVAISVGSGNKFVSIRDPDVFKQLRQSEYDSYSIIDEANLLEVSGKTQAIITANDSGWMFTLPPSENSVSESLTFDDQVFFVAFEPECDETGDCSSGKGAIFLYRMNVINGGPGIATTDILSRRLTGIEHRTVLQSDNIAPSSPVVLFPSADGDCAGEDCMQAPLVCIGLECFDPDYELTPTRMLWTKTGIN